MKKQKAVLIGDTRYFHVGSYTNCTYLTKILSEQYDFLGLFGDERFFFKDYGDFLEKIVTLKALWVSLYEADIVFLHGEGYVEPNSPYAEALYYVARYVKTNWPTKKIHLINFSCFDAHYWDWSIFDALVVRDKGSFECLKSVHPHLTLGFDCSILQNEELLDPTENKSILIFRGRKDITASEIELVKKTFPNKKVHVVSSFWPFSHDTPLQTQGVTDLQDLIKNAYLVISSSFHGIIFSTSFGVPFIPIETKGTRKNTSVAADILGSYYGEKDLIEWLTFYQKSENYTSIQKMLKEDFKSLQKRSYNLLV